MNSQNSLPSVATLIAKYEQAQKDKQLLGFFNGLCILPYDLVFSFIKKSEKAKNRSKIYCYTSIGADSFWTSKIPVHFFDDLLSPDNFLWEDMLLAYFNHKNNVNPDFVKLLAEKHPDKLIRFAKLSQAFLGERHWESFNQLIYSINQKFYIEMGFLKNELKSYKEKVIQDIDNLKGKVSYLDLLESLLILVETATYAEKLNRQDIIDLGLSTYSVNTLKAINEILEDKSLRKTFLADKISDRNNLPISEIIELLLDKIQVFEIEEIIDEVNFDEYQLIQQDDGIYYTEFIGDWSKNRHYLEIVKDKTRRDFYSRFSRDIVSDDEFFKNNDINLKTHEGFAAMFVQNAEVIESPQGTTWLPFEDENDLWNKVFNQHHAYYYRKTMESHYILKEEDKIKDLSLLVNEEKDIKIHSIISITAWIKAIATTIHNPVSFGWYNNKFFFGELFNQFPVNENTNEEAVLENSINIIRHLVYYYPDMLKHKRLNELVHFAEIDIFIQQMLNQNADLQNHTQQELEAILDYIVQIKLPGLRKIDKYLQIIPFAFIEIDHIDFIYNDLICKSLYKTQDNKNNSNSQHQDRESTICKKMEELFKLKFKYAKANVGFNDNNINSGDLKGEFDLMVVDDLSKSVLCIELKLKNTSLFNRKGKYEWFDDKILGKRKKIGAVQQLKKYYDYFHSSDCGKNQVKATFDLDIEIKTQGTEGYTFYSLIVTDNFYFDHFQIVYDSERKLSTMIISFFELKILLENLELFEEGTKNWVQYHYFHIYERNGLRNETIEAFMDDENQKEPSQEFIDIIKANKIPYFENEQLTVPELVEVIRKENKLWRPFHFWDFE